MCVLMIFVKENLYKSFLIWNRRQGFLEHKRGQDILSKSFTKFYQLFDSLKFKWGISTSFLRTQGGGNTIPL